MIESKGEREGVDKLNHGLNRKVELSTLMAIPGHATVT